MSVSDSGTTIFSTARQLLARDEPTATNNPCVAPAPCEVGPGINSFSLGMGVVIGAAGAALVAVAGKLCLHACYRSHFPNGLRLADSGPRSFDPTADDRFISASTETFWHSKETIPMTKNAC